MWSKLLYLSKNNGDGTYADPEPYRVNYQPITRFTDIAQYGQYAKGKYIAFVKFDEFKKVFSENDLVFLCGKDNEDGDCPYLWDKCGLRERNNDVEPNARVDSVQTQNLMIKIVFEVQP